MDKLNKLKALTGEGEVSVDTTASGTWSYNAKAQHIYEGTDSEEDEEEDIPPSRRIATKLISSRNHVKKEPSSPVNDSKEYQLQQGELAADGERFISWQTVKKYPYAYIGRANSALVSRHYFDQGKVYNNAWDFFYMYRPSYDPNQSPILLVPTKQFETLLQTINKELGLHLRIPSGYANDSGFQIRFSNDGTPRPRYLGRATNREMADRLQEKVPLSNFRLDGEPNTIVNPSQDSLVAFNAKINSMAKTQNRKKQLHNAKKQAERTVKKESWNQSIERIQRYLGIRRQSLEHEAEVIRARLQKTNLQWMDYDAAFGEAMANLPPTINLDIEKPSPYSQDGPVVFVCVDVEAYERNTRQITEIGIATFDTKDIGSLSPGKDGVNWRELIRARHFRIHEYKHLRNTEFINGCPDRFEFGESEFIKLKDVPYIVSTCFKHPFSQPGVEPSTAEDQKRNIVLVGHDVQADIKFLKTIGYDVNTLSTLIETADTSLMWRYIKKENNPRNLASILAELGIIGWNLHNAGNDAVYTLQAMVGIAIKALIEEQDKNGISDKRLDQVSESFNEPAARIWGIEEGSVLDGDDSDGGARVFLATGVKQSVNSRVAIKKALEGPLPPSKYSKVEELAWKTGLFTIEDTT